MSALTTFAENAITAVFTATDKATFEKAFDSFLAAEPTTLIVNGEKLTREKLHEQLWGKKSPKAPSPSQIKFLGAVANPTGNNEGEVGVFVKAAVNPKEGGPRTVTLSMNMLVKCDPSVQAAGDPYEGRRVFALSEVSSLDAN